MSSGRNLRFYISVLVMGLILALELSACGSGGLNGEVTTPGGYTPTFYVPSSSTTPTSSSTATTYTIGGTVSSVSGGNIASMVLTDYVSGTMVTAASDTYTITSQPYFVPWAYYFGSQVPNGSTYTVSITSQPATGNCSASNVTGTVVSSNVSNVYIWCP